MARPTHRLLKYPRPEDKIKVSEENLIVVEGADDFYTVGHLCHAHKISSNFRLEEAGGYENLRDSIDTRLLESGLQRIGFIVDADDSPADRWASLRGVLISDLCGYDAALVPGSPQAGGTIIVQVGKPRLGLWLMPDNQNSGALEPFLRSLVAAGDPLWPYAETCVANLPVLPPNASENWKRKAELHTWLAWRAETPGKPIGQAVDAKDFDPVATAAQPFVDWLRRLFEIAP